MRSLSTVFLILVCSFGSPPLLAQSALSTTATDKSSVISTANPIDAESIEVHRLNKGGERFWLAPFGQIDVPFQGAEWKIRDRKPASFTVDKDGSIDNCQLIVGEPTVDQKTRREMVEQLQDAQWASLDKPPFTNLRLSSNENKTHVPDNIEYHFAADAGKKAKLHLSVRLRFRHEHTYIWQAASFSQETARATIQIADTFTARSSDPPANLPSHVMKEVDAWALKTVQIIDGGDSDELLDQIASPIYLRELQKYPGQRKTMRDAFAGSKRVIKQLLSTIDWNLAKYNKERNEVVLASGQSSVRRLRKVEGKWGYDL